MQELISYNINYLIEINDRLKAKRTERNITIGTEVSIYDYSNNRCKANKSKTISMGSINANSFGKIIETDLFMLTHDPYWINGKQPDDWYFTDMLIEYPDGQQVYVHSNHVRTRLEQERFKNLFMNPYTY